MPTTPPPSPGLLDKRGATIRKMFGAAAPRYDLLNHLLSFQLDRLWRRRAVSSLALPPGSLVLDLAAGTGDLSFLLRDRGHLAVAGDFCFEMLVIARSKDPAIPILPKITADALALPFRDRAFDGLTIAFGVRNFENLDRGLAEMARVLRPGGSLAILELPPAPRGFFGALFRFYLSRVVPLLGRLVSPNPEAYGYLPASMADFLSPEALTDRIVAAGFDSVRFERLVGGASVLLVGRRRADGSASA